MIQDKLIKWYKENKRDLPFRNTDDPYKIWISEIMLQQTTVAAVIPYYERFINRFPTISSLSKADLEEVYKLWEGLGYYRRAKHIHETSKILMEKYDGVFPDEYEDILSLKGIGPYTASAISSFAFHKSYSAIDGNALRVLSRVFEIKENIALNKTVKMITELSNKLIVNHDSSSYNQGLMDLANMICKVKNPQCTNCPLSDDCLSYKHHSEKLLPISIKKVNHKELSLITGIITYEDQYLLIKNDDGLLENMYGLVQYEVESPYSFISKFEDDYHERLEAVSFIKDYRHVFTHRTWKMHVYHFVSSKPLDHMYTKEELLTLPIPTAHKKIITSII